DLVSAYIITLGIDAYAATILPPTLPGNNEIPLCIHGNRGSILTICRVGVDAELAADRFNRGRIHKSLISEIDSLGVLTWCNCDRLGNAWNPIGLVDDPDEILARIKVHEGVRAGGSAGGPTLS